MDAQPDTEPVTVDGPLDGEHRWSLTVPPSADADAARRGVGAAVATVAAAGGGPTQLWIEEADLGSRRAWADGLAADHGFRPYRDLWQMRCRLPAEPSDLEVRPFTEADADAFLAVNNRAFHWHPEQGGMTRTDLDARRAEPWYDPDGFLLHETDGQVIGFCWTKIHDDTDPPMGEIYAIAIDPAAHGRGLGALMTRAGLDHLAAQGLEVGMLYVESDNHPAVRTYERIGFDHHHTNRAYQTVVPARDVP